MKNPVLAPTFEVIRSIITGYPQPFRSTITGQRQRLAAHTSTGQRKTRPAEPTGFSNQSRHWTGPLFLKVARSALSFILTTAKIIVKKPRADGPATCTIELIRRDRQNECQGSPCVLAA
jgi:hypothetical protein